MRIQSYFVLFLVTVLFFGNSFIATSQEKRPNILLIMTDQHQAEALSVLGNKDINTPHLDKLAKGGMLFQNAYVTFPLCTPSRSSMFTGRMPHNLGVKSNEKDENVIQQEDKNSVLGIVLKQAGYDTAYGGKWHAHQASMVAGNGFEMIAPMGDVGLAEKSIAYLKSKQYSEKPFFLTVSFDNPHNICEWARNEPLPYGNIEKVNLDKTPQLPVNFKQSADFPEVLKIEQQASKKIYPTANYTEEDWRHYRYTYYQLVEKVDAEIGKILDAIDNLNLRNNTLIIFTSDHGDGNASHQWNQKTALIQESIKVPFIVSYKEKIQKNTTSKVAISNGLDLYSTICEYAKVEYSKELLGKNLKPLFEGAAKKLNRDYVVVETKFDGKYAFGTMGRAVIGNQYKYVLYNWGKNREQLFDLKNDPFELNNLATSKKHQKTLDLYRQNLYQWCKTTNDATFLRKLILPSSSKMSSTELFNKPY